MDPAESENNMFQAALEAVDQKDVERARDLFTRLIKQNPNKAEYWVWLSSLVPTAKEKTYCLQEALRIDPKSYITRRGLALQGVLPPDEKKIISLKHQHRNWNSQFRTPGLFERLVLIPTWAQASAVASLLIGLLIVGWVAYFSIPGLGGGNRNRLI
ncbi:MAG: hypothetical protein LWX83_15485, partial [Anaerolineae bacterium]|nr:hypothetical protein [Anaerolineae bacterium]